VPLRRHVPDLLRRARALLALPGGPPERLAPVELRTAARAVEALHEGLIGRRALARSGTYDDAAHLGAYLLWWWPQTYAKTESLLTLARGAGAMSGVPARPRILDAGAGSGPAAMALLDALAGSALAVDASETALAEARALSGGLVETQRLDLTRRIPPFGTPFDVVVMANALSEIPEESRAALVDALPVSDRGAVLLLEPALRETGRALLQLRDGLLRGRRWTAAAPCLTQRPCPALQNPRDWCTVHHAWEPPPHLVQLADELGLRADEELAYAPLVLTRRVAVPDPEVWRVVGVPRPEKGKRRLFVCNDQGRVPVARLDRDASDANADFERLGRGDLVRLRGVGRKGDGLRIGAEAEVRRLDPDSQAGEHR
jgi:SAM-dependent methyltransferase